MKRSNKTEKPVAEDVEGRGPAKRNLLRQNTLRTQSRVGVPNALERVRAIATKDKGVQFTALLHHVTIDRLRAAYSRLKREAAPGVDGVTWEQYGENLEGNLQDLYARVHRGAYRAKPSRRTYILKADGRQRPLGIAALEDKVLQAAVVEVMNAIYEADFRGFSYGFRPGRNPHLAADALVVGIMTKKVNWLLDADIRSFFDTINHERLLALLQHRIRDRRLLRLIQKWLGAGVLENGEWRECETGAPQGAVISPLLANVYLHYVLDDWVHQWRKTQATGDVVVVRFADDFVVGFEHQVDADRCLQALRERMQEYGLELHPEKTRLLEFGRAAATNRRKRGAGKPETFRYLGFTYISGTTRSGAYQVHRRTDPKRMQAKLAFLTKELARRRPQPLPSQGAWLGSVVRGWNRYHGVPGNRAALARFRIQVARRWLRSLRRRGQLRRLTWDRMNLLVARWLPRPRICQPWPSERIDRWTQGKSRMR